MKIINKKIKQYKNTAGRPGISPAFVTSYIIETSCGKITYRVCDTWTALIDTDGNVNFIKKKIEMNEDNPQESLDKFESLLVLK